MEQRLTDAEWQLIETLRNYRRGYPNTKFLAREIKELVARLKDPQTE